MVERVAIIGGGVMGRNHARTLKGIGGIELSHMVDADITRATRLAQDFGSEATVTTTSIGDISAENTDAAIIVSPSQFHEAQARALIESGVHVLIEKPVAESPESTLAIDRVARQMGVIAMAGHIELFNPTIHSLLALLKDETIREMSFERLGSVPDTSRLYHDVVSDLMLHDIAIAIRILEQSGLSSEGEIRAAIARSDTVAPPDPARATIRFGSVDAHFRASRAYPAGKVRRVVVETDSRILTADLLARDVQATSANSAAYTPDGVLTEDTFNTRYFPQESMQPLTLEQRHFIASINGEAFPEDAGVSLRDAAKVLKLTREILKLSSLSPLR